MTIHEDKTAAQLRREISYFSAQLARTGSRDRQRRAHIAIRIRETALTKAIAREATRRPQP